jgi:flagellar motor switch/type III secretory pathway protein FliN
MTTALALAKPEETKIDDAAWQEAAWLPCRATVEVAVPGFTLGDLLSLAVDSVVATKTARSGELLVLVNGQWLANAELDVVGDRYAARLTDFAGQAQASPERGA